MKEGADSRLTLHNPLGYDNVIRYDKAWPQLYLYDYLTSFPTRKDFGLGPIVESVPYQLVPPPGEKLKPTSPKNVSANPAKAVNAAEQKGPAAPMDQISEMDQDPTSNNSPNDPNSGNLAKTTTTTTTTVYLSRQTASASEAKAVIT